MKRLSALCARKEMCRQDAKKKLILWKIPEDERPSIIDTLIKYSFIDEERYAKA